jgi:hypothetical protein
MNFNWMEDDYWKDKTVADVSYFLATGDADGCPKFLENGSNLLELQLAYLEDWTDYLGVLLKATFLRSRSNTSKQFQLHNLERKSILEAIKKETRLLDKLKPEIRDWLENRPHKAKERRSKRESFILATKGLRERTIMRAACVRKSEKNKRLYSPELDKIKEQEFYLKQVQSIKSRITKDSKNNKKILTLLAKRIHTHIYETHKSKNPETVNYLLCKNKVPSKRYVLKHVYEVRWLTLGK